MPQFKLAHQEMLWHVLFFNPQFQQLYYGGVIHGFVPDRNQITHARIHKGAGAVLTLDVFRAFETTDKARVIDALTNIGVTGNLLDFLEQNAFVKDNHGNAILAPGFPTSQDLFNLVFLPIDIQLTRLARENGMKYSRYADDLAFSTSREVESIPQIAIEEIRAIVQNHGYDLHKIRVGKPWQAAVKICGLVLIQDRMTLSTQRFEELREHLIGCFAQDPPDWQKALGIIEYIKKSRGLPERLRRYEDLANQLRREAKRNRKLKISNSRHEHM